MKISKLFFISCLLLAVILITSVGAQFNSVNTNVGISGSGASDYYGRYRGTGTTSGSPGFGGFLGGSRSVSRQYYRAGLETIYSGSDIKNYWPILDDDPDKCEGRQDLLLNIAPAGCQPSVVRSDLLAEQNVPVFCQIDSYKLNPLINIKDIKNIRFIRGNKSEHVTGVGFHPARAALRSYDRLLGSPLINNIGYVVVLLKRNPVEKDLPEEVIVNLGAQIEYESGNALGIGRAEFILTPTNDDEWVREKSKQSFWQGRYSVRLEEANPEFALISIYYGDRKIRTLRVERGKTSDSFYVPGGYCRAGLQVSYDGVIAPRAKASLEISDEIGTDYLDVYAGSSFLNNKCTVRDIFVAKDGSGSVYVDCGGLERFRLDLKRREVESVVDKDKKEEKKKVNLEDEKISEDADKFFEDAVKYYEQLADDYPEVREFSEIEFSERLGEKALYKAIELSRQFKKLRTEERLIQRYLEIYPSSQKKNLLNERLTELYEIDSSLSGISLNLDNGVRNIRVVELKQYEGNGVGGEFSVGGGEKLKIGLGQERTFKDKRTVVRLDRIIDKDRAEVSVFCDGKTLPELERGNAFSRSYNYVNRDLYQSREDQGTKIQLEKGKKGEDVCGNKEVIEMSSLSGELFARVKIIPSVRGTRTETNLTVAIGIEKRAIKLSPEKTEELIENFGDSIKKWENINEKLGSFVSAMKGACFATATVLTAKNFFAGLGGESLAREQVMGGSGGWTDRCKDSLASGKPVDSKHSTYVSMDDCFRQNADAIRNDVSKRASIISDYDKRIKGHEGSDCVESGGGFLSGDKVINDDCSAEYLIGDLKGYQKDKSLDFAIPGRNKGDNYKVDEFVEGLPEDAWKDGHISIGQLKDLRVNSEILSDSGSSPVMKEAARIKIADIMDGTKNRIDSAKETAEVGSFLGSIGEQDTTINDYGGPRTINGVYNGRKYNTNIKINGIDDSYYNNDKPIEYLTRRGKEYAIILKPSSSGEGRVFVPEKVYEIVKEDNGEYKAIEQKDALNSLESGREAERKDIIERYGEIDNFRFERFDSSSYRNRYLNPKVRYYETEPNKGLPSVVPFDPERGWYVGTRQILPILGQQSDYQSNGRAKSFWLCNVGQNQREEFERSGFGDDTCQQFNFYTGQPLNKFPGLSETETRQLVQRAQSALSEASQRYGSGLQSVRIGSHSFSVGNPAVNVASAKCQDFMDPGDCQIMFNVCDPVICPNSRCNLGGNFYVSNVVQSGIVGSALLCLPNIREGIFVPVCLTGIHAGIESYLSILKTHQECLQHSLDTGQTVGICDQITSVYLCKFFWEQIAPAAKVLLPKLVEAAYGQGTRGGGEYLTVMNAWQNTQNSIDYFTQQYAVNALDAYKIRSVGEIGSQFCKAFVSAKGPTSFESLIEPDSPVQFYAQFDSVKFSDATVPATSQYKTFYHIFAGNDQGVQYVVYLKSPGESSIYIPSELVVANGFIPRGEKATESKDFTAPEGYKELCVSINGQEKCGFQQVSTSFALNYVRDEFASAETTRKNIRSERDCISGAGDEIRLGALINPNIQSGLGEFALPEVYNRGIVRICSTENPGLSTEPSRFVEVGTCGNERVRCWLDSRSVDNAISDDNRGVRNATLSELNKIQQERLIKEEGALFGESASIKIKELKEKLGLVKGVIQKGKVVQIKEDVGKFVNEVDSVLIKTVLNDHKAELLLIKGDVNELAARKLFGVLDIDAERRGNGDGNEIVISVINNWVLRGTVNKLALYNGNGLVNENVGYISEGKIVITFDDGDNGLWRTFVSVNKKEVSDKLIELDGKSVSGVIRDYEENLVGKINPNLIKIENGILVDIDEKKIYDENEKYIGKANNNQIEKANAILDNKETNDDLTNYEVTEFELGREYVKGGEKIYIKYKGEGIRIYLQNGMIWTHNGIGLFDAFYPDTEIGSINGNIMKFFSNVNNIVNSHTGLENIDTYNTLNLAKINGKKIFKAVRVESGGGGTGDERGRTYEYYLTENFNTIDSKSTIKEKVSSGVDRVVFEIDNRVVKNSNDEVIGTVKQKNDKNFEIVLRDDYKGNFMDLDKATIQRGTKNIIPSSSGEAV